MAWEDLMTEQHLILAIAAWIEFVALKSFVHFYVIDIQKTNPHAGQTRVLNWILTGMGSICHGASFPFPENDQVGKFIVILFFQIMWHMVIFGPMQNKLRGREYFYLGQDSGGFDKYFVGKPIAYRIYYGAYCAAAIVSIWLLNIIFRP